MASRAGRVFYEITATVAEPIRNDWYRYMVDEHIPDLLATRCFADASIGRSADGRFRIWYEAHSRDDLDRYLRVHAERLRAHALQRFPEGIEITRNEWEIFASISASQPAG
ncbi:MAG: DUF4286 family protein [Pyrinomonadaceae bacterium]|nr:DUF4286 family protein [Pyrinomonadaceae bacterium]